MAEEEEDEELPPRCCCCCLLLLPLLLPRTPFEDEEDAAAASEEEASSADDSEEEEEEELGAHEPMRTTSASCGGKGPRHPPVAASHACDEPRMVATCDAVLVGGVVGLGEVRVVRKTEENGEREQKRRRKNPKKLKKRKRTLHPQRPREVPDERASGRGFLLGPDVEEHVGERAGVDLEGREVVVALKVRGRDVQVEVARSFDVEIDGVEFLVSSPFSPLSLVHLSFTQNASPLLTSILRLVGEIGAKYLPTARLERPR